MKDKEPQMNAQSHASGGRVRGVENPQGFGIDERRFAGMKPLKRFIKREGYEGAGKF